MELCASYREEESHAQGDQTPPSGYFGAWKRGIVAFVLPVKRGKALSLALARVFIEVPDAGQLPGPTVTFGVLFLRI